MPSARSTLAIVAAALVYGTSVLAVSTENSYDLAERDYSDVAELDARMYDMDLEEYYVREGEATPAVATAPTTPAHAHKHKGHHHKPGYKSLHSYSHVTPPASPYTATSKLSTREPKRGKGHGKGRKWRGRKGKGYKGKKGGAAPAEAAAAPADASAEPPAARDLEADDEMLSAREPKGGKGRGGKGRRHRHKGHKGKGRKSKGGAPPAEAAAAPAEAPAEAPATREIVDDEEMISAREPKGGKRHGHKKGKGKGRKGKGRKGGKGKKAAAAAAPAEAAPADAYAAAEPPVARALSNTTVTDEKVTEKSSSPTVDATSPAPAHKKSHKAYKKSHKAHKKSHKKALKMKKVNKAHRLYRHRLDGAKKHEGTPATTPTPSASAA